MIDICCFRGFGDNPENRYPHYTRFAIRLGSVQDVQDFVAVTTTRPFTITVRDENNKINADSFMELFCLNFSHPLRVVCDCSEAELNSLKQDLACFVVND